MVWVVEKGNGYGIMFEAYRKLYESKGIQKIEIYDTRFGKLLMIDGCVQLVEAFESIYHEMLVHVPMFTHPRPKRVLLIGGGDGGALREILKHDPEKVVMVEIDENVIKACKEHIGLDENALEDERVELRIEDGINYVKTLKERFDVLIVDGTDPSPASMSLFSREFFKACSKASDVFCMQSQSPALQKDYFKLVVRNTAVFERRAFYLSCIPMYPGGIWSFMIGSNKMKVLPDIDELRLRFSERNVKTKHYTPQLHVSSFSLPRWMAELING